MSVSVNFPQLSQEHLVNILTPPIKKSHNLQVVLDTDLDNEVDDYFALVWLLLQNLQPSSELNKIDLKAVHIAPYSFKTRLDNLIQAYKIYLKPVNRRTDEEKHFLSGYEKQIQSILSLGTNPFALQRDPHLNGDINFGIEQSCNEILEIFKLMGVSSQDKVFKGANRFMSNPYQVVESDAAHNLVKLALDCSPDNPLYVIAIGCPTNIASALLIDHKIRRNIVVIWDAGFPTNVYNKVNNSLNLDEDLYASQLLFSSGVPLVYIPGFYIAQQLNLSLPDVEAWFKHSGQVGKRLYNRYINNPLFSFYGIDPKNLFGRSWVIWDIANVAWLLNPDSVPSHFVNSPILTDKKEWQVNPNGHLMREAYQISVNAIFPELAGQLKNWSNSNKCCI